MLPKIARRNEFIKPFFEDGFFDDFFAPLAHWNSSLPKTNISEHEKDFSIEMAMPGIPKDEIKISVENDILTVEKEEKSQKENKGENYTVKEFSYSAFKRSFKLPKNIEESNIKSKYEDGILKIIVPKIKQKEKITKTIKIE